MQIFALVSGLKMDEFIIDVPTHSFTQAYKLLFILSVSTMYLPTYLLTYVYTYTICMYICTIYDVCQFVGAICIHIWLSMCTRAVFIGTFKLQLSSLRTSFDSGEMFQSNITSYVITYIRRCMRFSYTF